MKAITVQIRRPQCLLTFGAVLLTAGLILGSEPDPATESGESCEAIKPPVDAVPVPPLNGKLESFAPAVKKVAPAVVRIVTALRADSLSGAIEDPLLRSLVGQMPGGHSRRSLECGLGSGVIVTEDGYILTNSHLVNGPTEIKVTLQDGREFNAKVIGFDAQSDIAIIKINAHHLPTVPLAESRNVQVGDLVLAIGNPFGVGQTVTHGIVSATDRGGMGIEDYESFIQTDAPINPGNSGGALVDVNGRLIGINTAILSRTGGNLGIGFAVPSDLARRVMTDLVKYGYVVRGYLGVEAQNLTPELAKELNLDRTTGALVAAVVPNGPAARAGLEVGDVITRFDGKPAGDARQLRLVVAEAKPCHTVQVEVLRNGSTQPLRVTIAQASDYDRLAKADCSYDKHPGPLQGVTMGELNSQLRQQLKVPRYVQGAVVVDVTPYSAAADAGLRPGDVILSMNRHEVENAQEASRLTQNAKDKRALLRVWSNSGSRFILVD
jgi:serine protease Do